MIRHFYKTLISFAIAWICPFSFAAAIHHEYVDPSDGSRQSLLYFAPEKPRAILFAIHGLQSHAGWLDKAGVGELLARDGIFLVAPDRRGSGDSSSLRGDATSATQLLNDLEAALDEAEKVFRSRYALTTNAALPDEHIFAASFGAKLAIPFLMSENLHLSFKSAIFSNPALFMRPETDYGLLKKLLIFFAPAKTRFRSPLRPQHFTDNPNYRNFIDQDEKNTENGSVLFFTKRFLTKAAKPLGQAALAQMHQVQIPTLLILNPKDPVVDASRVAQDFFFGLEVEDKKMLITECESHSIEFSSEFQSLFIKEISDWVLAHSGRFLPDGV